MRLRQQAQLLDLSTEAILSLKENVSFGKSAGIPAGNLSELEALGPVFPSDPPLFNQRF